MKHKEIIRDVVYSMSCNTNAMVVSVILVIFLPKFLSLTEYGLWQLFLFYFSYVGFLHFGWEDGIYLRYAGTSYHDLDKSMIYGQSVLIFVMQLLIGITIFEFSEIFLSDIPEGFIFQMLSIVIVLANMNNLFSFIFQMTSRIKEYARISALEPLFFMLAVAAILICGWREAHELIWCKVLSLSLVCIIAIYVLRDIWQASLPSLSDVLSEAGTNIAIGSKLMLANIASMLIIGVVRFGISQGWDVVVFGKISLTLSISNFLLVFINAVSVVLLPALRHVDKHRQQELYDAVRPLLTAFMMILLLLYYPLYVVLQFWLPQYIDVLQYMAILFPVCLTESRMALLINTYLKAMRLEKMMLWINIISVIFSAVFTIFCVIFLHDLLACIFSIVIIFAFKAYWAEWNLCHILHRKFWSDIIIELIMISLFILFAWYIGGLYGFLGYVISLTLYMVMSKSQLFSAYHQFAND